MQVQHVGYRIRGFDRVGALGHLWEMTPQDAQERLRILGFWDTHGLLATREAFEVSCRTLDRWKAELQAQGDNTAALVAKGSAPRRRRCPRTDPRLGTEIWARRSFLSCWALGARSTALRGPRSPGRADPARAPDKMRFATARLDARGRPRPLRRRPKTRRPGPRPSKAGRGIPSSAFATVSAATS